MKVNIKKFEVPVVVKTKGIEFGVSANGKQVGDLLVTKAYVIWCKKKTTRRKGKRVPWKKFIQLMESSA